jgi:phosphoenolpyruvate carboxykinase (ATP)
MWLMNTGYVGGDAYDEEKGTALKVKIAHSSAMLEAMLQGDIRWKLDPDFGYEIPDTEAPENVALMSKVPREILNPKLLYEQQGRLSEYSAWVDKVKEERRAFLEGYKVSPEIIKSVCK